MKSKLSFKEFVSKCKKKRPLSRIYYAYLFHQISYPISYSFYLIGVSANTISILGILTTLTGGILIFKGFLFGGIILFLIGHLLDTSDGNVARIYYDYEGRPREKLQLRGLLLENLYTNIAYSLFFFSLGFYFYSNTQMDIYLILGITSGFIKLLTRYTVFHASHLSRSSDWKEVSYNKVNEELNSMNILNEIKYFITRIVDSGRFYYFIFLFVMLLIPDLILQVFVVYMMLIIFLNFIKIILTLKTRQP